MPPHQLDAVFQSVLVMPVQEPIVHPVATVTIPELAATNHTSFLLVAEEPLDPHVPETWLVPPRSRLFAVEEVPFVSRAFAVPFIDSVPELVMETENVFVPLPLIVRLLYDFEITVWFVPLYSTVLVPAKVVVE